MVDAFTEQNREQTTGRKISPRLLLGIIFLPIIFAWFLWRNGYGTTAKILSLIWMLPSSIFTLMLAIAINPPDALLSPKINGAAQETVASGAATKLPTDVPSNVPTQESQDKEAEYLELLELAGDDTEGDMFTRDEGDPRATWESALMTMGTTAKFYEDGAEHAVSDNAKSKQRAYVQKIGGLQSAAFPKLRSYYGQDMKKRLWEHDVDVTVSGPRNSTLRFTGFWFASNRNIKQISETAHPDALALRFKRMEFRSHKFSDTTSYDLKSLPDSQLATFAYNRWTPVD